MLNWRNLVESDQFTRAVGNLIPGAKRADEALEGVKEVLARDPTKGHQAPCGIWIIKTHPIGGIRFTVFYTFDAEKVDLLALVAQQAAVGAVVQPPDRKSVV